MKTFKQLLEEVGIEAPTGEPIGGLEPGPKASKAKKTNEKKGMNFTSFGASVEPDPDKELIKELDPDKEEVSESSPPDPEIEKWIKANKARFKSQYGAEKGTQVLYAKAWSMYKGK